MSEEQWWEAPPKRSLRPLKPTTATERIKVIAICDKEILLESTGERLPDSELVPVFERANESIIVTDGFDHVFYRLNEHFKGNPQWQYKSVIQEMQGDNRVSNVVSFFGFKRTNHHRYRRARYFYPVDLSTFVRDLSLFKGADALAQMFELGTALRDFCLSMGLRPRTTGAGLAAQLLRHPNFYPEARRRVPTFVNERARPHLPGNHYDLFVGAGENVEAATYIDQQAAHHHAVRETPLPDANSLYGRGNTRERGRGPWLYPGERAYARTRRQFGLLYVRLQVPYLSPDKHRFVPPLLRSSGMKDCYVWTNELDYLEEWGATVLHIIAAYTSPDKDVGLPAYAEWAQKQPPWLKQALLTTYGILATRPRRTRFVHAKGKGEAVQAPLGAYLIDGFAGAIREFSSNGVANVVQRGLIESYVRRLSLELARELEQEGGEVVSIYGDGVFVRTVEGQQLALPMRAPWRTKRQVHNLRFEAATRLRSDEFTRLPGTPRFFREFNLQEG